MTKRIKNYFIIAIYMLEFFIFLYFFDFRKEFVICLVFVFSFSVIFYLINTFIHLPLYKTIFILFLIGILLFFLIQVYIYKFIYMINVYENIGYWLKKSITYLFCLITSIVTIVVNVPMLVICYLPQKRK